MRGVGVRATGSASGQRSLVRVAAVVVLVNLVVSGFIVMALRWPNPQPIRLSTAVPEAAPALRTAETGADRSAGDIDISTTAPAPSDDARIDINTADAATLESLPGIGPALAGRIIRYREEQGPFSTIEELMNVQGIGERTYDRLRGLVTVR